MWHILPKSLHMRKKPPPPVSHTFSGFTSVFSIFVQVFCASNFTGMLHTDIRLQTAKVGTFKAAASTFRRHRERV